MIGALVVTVLVDGAPVPASAPAILSRGVVTCPVDPFARAFARRISFDAAKGRITFERDGKVVSVVLGSRVAETGRGSEALPVAPYLRAGLVIIPLAATARALGAGVRFDGRSKVVDIQLPPAEPIATMTPYLPGPRPTPLETFTPNPVSTPRPAVSGIPRPRRTPIVVEERR